MNCSIQKEKNYNNFKTKKIIVSISMQKKKIMQMKNLTKQRIIKQNQINQILPSSIRHTHL